MTNSVNVEGARKFLKGNHPVAKAARLLVGPVKPQRKNKKIGRTGKQGGNY